MEARAVRAAANRFRQSREVQEMARAIETGEVEVNPAGLKRLNELLGTPDMIAASAALHQDLANNQRQQELRHRRNLLRVGFGAAAACGFAFTQLDAELVIGTMFLAWFVAVLGGGLTEWVIEWLEGRKP